MFIFYNYFAAQIGSPSAPFVVSMESITNNSVDIGWVAANHANVTYLLQWKYVNSEGSTWTSYHTQVSVHKYMYDLHNYTLIATPNSSYSC